MGAEEGNGGWRKEALAASKANVTSDSTLERPSGVDGEARTYSDSPQLHVSKRKAEHLSSSDSTSKPAAALRLGHQFGEGLAAQGTTDELVAQRSQQFCPTEDGLQFAAVVAGRAALQKPTGPQNFPAKVSEHTEPAASSEVATRRMSLGDTSGLLCGMPGSITSSAQMATNSAAPCRRVAE